MSYDEATEGGWDTEHLCDSPNPLTDSPEFVAFCGSVNNAKARGITVVFAIVKRPVEAKFQALYAEAIARIDVASGPPSGGPATVLAIDTDTFNKFFS